MYDKTIKLPLNSLPQALSQELAALQTKFEEVNAQIAGLGSTSTLGTTV